MANQKVEEIKYPVHAIYHETREDFAEEEDEHINNNKTVAFQITHKVPD